MNKKQRDYQQTEEMIKNAYKDIIKDEKRMPSQGEVAKMVGVSRVTVNKHLNSIDLSKLVQPFRLFGNEVLTGLMKKASEGDTQAAKLFFMLIYDWSEKQKIEHEGEVKINYVPIPEKIAKKVADELAKDK